MTTTSAVAARHVVCGEQTELRWQRALVALRGRSRVRLAGCALVLVAGLGLAGCGSSGLLDSSSTTTQQAASPAALPVQPPKPVVSQSKVGLAPVMGAPEAVGKAVSGQLGSALERQRVAVAQGDAKPDYTVRGYMVATKERAGTKVSYIFDLTDAAGKRVNRIQGEEIAPAGDGRDPWSAITPEVAQRISDKTASSLSTALASLGPASNAGATRSAPADSSASTADTAPVGVGSPVSRTEPAAATQPSPAPAVAASGSTTGSIDRGASGSIATAIVPAVRGAPGDGNDTLASAMRQELQQAGVGTASSGQRAYSVAGTVSVGAVKDGKQPVKIDWRVTDPAGTLLATVSQNNEIQAGALDGPWGSIANDAASGAASRIKQLIDESQAAGGGGGSPPRARAAQKTKS